VDNLWQNIGDVALRVSKEKIVTAVGKNNSGLCEGFKNSSFAWDR
jgi:hypothetical protein